jgi:outer membrane biosynthesis protein TonB
LSNAVAVAVAAVLFFFLSVPVENTYVEQGNYASLGTDCLFDAIRSQSVATNLMDIPAPEVPKQKAIKPVAVKVEKVLPAKEIQPKAPETPVVKTTASKAPVAKAVTPKAEPVKESPKKVAKPASKNKYRIIVSSLPTASDAQKMVKKYHQQGYTEASVVEGNGRFRIALYSYSDKNAAYQKMESLKKEAAFKSAWMLSSK